MQSAMIVVMGIAGMAFGWFVYSKFIAEKIYQLDSDFVTPAHELNDGVDFHPTNKYVLWGHHFTSVAGALPVTGKISFAILCFFNNDVITLSIVPGLIVIKHNACMFNIMQ